MRDGQFLAIYMGMFAAVASAVLILNLPPNSFCITWTRVDVSALRGIWCPTLASLERMECLNQIGINVAQSYFLWAPRQKKKCFLLPWGAWSTVLHKFLLLHYSSHPFLSSPPPQIILLLWWSGQIKTLMFLTVAWSFNQECRVDYQAFWKDVGSLR